MKPEKANEPASSGWYVVLVATVALVPPTLLAAGWVVKSGTVEEPAPAPVAEVAVAPEPPPGPDPAVLLQASQDHMKVLEAELDAREAELAELKAQGEKAKKETRGRIARLEKQIASLKGEIGVADAERTDLRQRLGTALAERDAEVGAHAETQARVVAAEGANSENLWVAFTQQARMEMCQQVTRKGREACGEKLGTWFDETQHARFSACVSDSRTVPILWHKGNDEEEAPSNAAQVDVDVALFGQRRDWYVLYCDPNLPEAQMAAATAPPPVFVPNPWRSQ